MGLSRMGRLAALTTAVIFVLAGCGGAATTGTMPLAAMTQGRAHKASGKSWMLPEAKNEDLLYVANYFAAVNVYNFRTLALVGTLSVYYPGGECTDESGNVFITSVKGSSIVEYAHGGTTPIATLTDSSFYPDDCFIDTASGNLCVANLDGGVGGSSGNLSIYRHAEAPPQSYVDANPYDDEYFACTYDGDGNAFVDVSGPDGHLVFDELPVGAKKLKRIWLGHNHHRSSDLDWDGRFLTNGDAANTVYRFSVGVDRKRVYYDGRTMLRAVGSGVATTRVVPYAGALEMVGTVSGNAVQIWRYPSGWSLRYITSGLDSPDGVAVSLAPTHSRIHK